MPTSTPPTHHATEVAGRLRFVVARLHRLLRQQDQAGLSATMGAALATIARDGPLSLGDLAARERLAPPSVTKLVGKLHAQGFIDKAVDPDDRRVTKVAISVDGARQLEQARNRRTAWLLGQLESLDPADQARLAAAVEVLELLVDPTGVRMPTGEVPVVTP